MQTEQNAVMDRLTSLDAYRGFVMLAMACKRRLRWGTLHRFARHASLITSSFYSISLDRVEWRACRLGLDPAFIHVHGRRRDAVFLCEPARPRRLLAAIIWPCRPPFAGVGRAGGLSCVEWRTLYQVLVRECTGADRARIPVRLLDARQTAPSSARCSGRDSGRRLATLQGSYPLSGASDLGPRASQTIHRL